MKRVTLQNKKKPKAVVRRSAPKGFLTKKEKPVEHTASMLKTLEQMERYGTPFEVKLAKAWKIASKENHKRLMNEFSDMYNVFGVMANKHAVESGQGFLFD